MQQVAHLLLLLRRDVQIRDGPTAASGMVFGLGGARRVVAVAVAPTIAVFAAPASIPASIPPTPSPPTPVASPVPTPSPPSPSSTLLVRLHAFQFVRRR